MLEGTWTTAVSKEVLEKARRLRMACIAGYSLLCASFITVAKESPPDLACSANAATNVQEILAFCSRVSVPELCISNATMHDVIAYVSD